MSLINRIALSNLSNMHGKASQAWEPRFRYEVLNCHGQSVAMNLINGGGKTTLAEGMLAVLSRDRTLVSNTKVKFSPESTRVWSHIQIELITPHNTVSQADLLASAGGDVGGETWVFGMCGHRGASESVTYYFFPGTLEDLPIGQRDEKKTRLTSNKEFKEAKQRIKGMQWGADKAQWEEKISQHLSLDGIRQLVTFQKKGGSDKSAQLFNFKKRPGESYAAAFFYEVLAPAVMSDLMQKEGEEGEHRLEDTLYETLMRVVRAKRKTQKKREEVEAQEHAAAQLGGVDSAAEQAGGAQQHYHTLLNEVALDARVLTQLVGENPVPGVPRAQLPEGLEGELVPHVVMEPGADEIRITDRGLSVLLGVEPRIVNQLADRNHIAGRKISQLIEIPCDSFSSQTPKRGPKSDSYTLGQAKAVLQTASKFSQNLNCESATALLEDVETWFEKKADTNPFRQSLIEARVDLDEATKAAEEAQNTLDVLHQQKSRLGDQKRELKENEGRYNDLCRSGLFTEVELAEPRNTGKAVEAENADAEQVMSAFNATAATLAALSDDWEAYFEQHGDEDPHVIEMRYEAEDAAAREALKQHDAQLKLLGQKRDAVASEIQSLETDINKIENSLDRFAELEDSIVLYEQHFGESDPKGLDRELLDEAHQLESRLKELKTEIGNCETALDALGRFEDMAGTADPAAWLDDVGQERERLIGERDEQSRRLKNLERQRNALEKEAIAAGQLLQDALDLLSSHEPGYTPVHDFILHQDIAWERKTLLLASFSALLFAPVFSDPAMAGKAATLLHENDLPVPVFVDETLASYCAEGAIQEITEAELFVGLHAGIKTRQVECLLDPTLVEREKADLDARISDLSSSLVGLRVRLAEIDSEGELVLLARQAREAITSDAAGRLESAKTAQAETESDLRALQPQIADEVIAAIRDMQQYVRLGGHAKRDKLLSDLERLTAQKTEKQTEAEVLAAEIETERAGGDTLQAAVDTAYPAETRALIGQAKKFWDKEGPQFNAHEAERRAELEARLQVARDRNEYKRLFGGAQSYLDALAAESRGETLDGQLEKLNAQIDTTLKTRDSEKARVLVLSKTTVPALREVVEALDRAACAVLERYRSIAELGEDVTSAAIDTTQLEAHPAWEAGYELSQAARAEAEDLARAVQFAQTLADAVADMDVVNKGMEVRRARSESIQAEKRFVEAAHKTGELEQGLAPSEREKLRSVVSVADAPTICGFYRTYLSILNDAREELAELSRGEEGARRDIAEHTAFMIGEATDNLRTLQKVVRRDHGEYKSHFIVDAEVVDQKGAAALIERILCDMEVADKRREEDEARGVGARDDAAFRDSMRQTIRNTVYRSIFSNPTVRYVNERIRMKGEHEFDEALSEGEKTALSLMWTIRLAEFAIEREMRNMRPSAKRKARSRAENILIIDGMFSNLSEPALIDSVMAGIEDTRGRFQLIGLIHHPDYKNNFKVFPVFLLGRKHVAPGGGAGWVSFDEQPVAPEAAGHVAGSVGFAQVSQIPARGAS